jgi:hypothetical protein
LEVGFAYSRCVVRFTGDERTHLIELELPLNQTGKIEKAIKDGVLSLEVDKIHGLDPILHKVLAINEGKEGRQVLKVPSIFSTCEASKHGDSQDY